MRNWLIKKRKELNITQHNLSVELNLSESFYSQIENDKRNPSIATAKRIATKLDFDWKQFFEDEKNKED